MGNVGIELADPVFECRHRVLYGDTDSGGVVYYGNYLRYFEMGRTELMRSIGLPYSQLEADGLILPVVENYARYKASARYDDLIVIRAALAEAGKVSCRFHYHIRRHDDGTLLVKGFTVHAVVNRRGKLARFPDNILTFLRKHQMSAGEKT